MQEIPVWCEEVLTFGGTDTRYDLKAEEALNGWVKNASVSAQQLNQLFYLLTSSAKVNPFSPDLLLATEELPSECVEWVDGGAIPQTEAPLLYEHYNGVFPTLQTYAPIGWKYIARKI